MTHTASVFASAPASSTSALLVTLTACSFLHAALLFKCLFNASDRVYDLPHAKQPCEGARCRRDCWCLWRSPAEAQTWEQPSKRQGNSLGVLGGMVGVFGRGKIGGVAIRGDAIRTWFICAAAAATDETDGGNVAVVPSPRDEVRTEERSE